MKLRTIFFCVAVAVPGYVFAAAGDFTRSLKEGMRGEDVRALQVVLNARVETRVAASGAGSPGNETDYFGPATKRAVIKFQEKYREEVLVPAGLTAGTGFFGEKTRIKASALRSQGINTVPPVQKDVVSSVSSSETPSVLKGEVIIAYPSRYSGKPGTSITLSGMGFTSTDNTVYFGDNYTVAKASSWNGQLVSLKVPQIPKGNYYLWVKNARGESNKDTFFVVTDGITSEPKIESLSPTSGRRGTVITLTGSGFTAKGNMVRLGSSVFENVSSPDGSSLSVTLPSDMFSTEMTSPSAKTISIPIWAFIVNENGVSNGKSFTLEL